MLKRHAGHLFTSWVNWRFRVRPVSAGLFAAGLPCLGFALAGGLGFKANIPIDDKVLTVDLSTNGGTPEFLIWGSAFVGFCLIFLATYMSWRNYQREQVALARKKITVIELRGLRDGAGTSLVDNVTGAGQREAVLLDIRQGVEDGAIVDPERAVEKLSRVRDDLAQRETGRDRSDLKRVFGGLAPVPLTFLAGVLIDDEEETEIWDWSRHERRWLPLDADDNGGRFEIDGLEELGSGESEVALLVSTSYDLDHAGINKRIGSTIGRVTMRLSDAGADAHWSEEKQVALGAQFFQTVQAIGNSGARKIHLFLAAQSSVVFRLGTLYDKRNLPVIWIYQYERSTDPPYPWAIEMPAGEKRIATVQRFAPDIGQ